MELDFNLGSSIEEGICRISIEFANKLAHKNCFSFKKCNKVESILFFLLDMKMEFDKFIKEEAGYDLNTSKRDAEDLLRIYLKAQRNIRKTAILSERFTPMLLMDLLDYQVKDAIHTERKRKNTGLEFEEIIYHIIRSGRDILKDKERVFIPLKILEYIVSWHITSFIIKEREEKEKLREELIALKELKKERDRAEKDEQKAREAIEKNKASLEKAKTETQILKLKAQIAELEVALQRAIERKERAISMAQQTRCGFVYVISNIGSFGEGVYKIGMTRRIDPMQRIRELGDASVPFPFDVHAMIYTEDAPSLESHLHKVFDSQKVNVVNWRKEYFKVSLNDIRREVENSGIYCQWKEKPEAKQFHESEKIKYVKSMSAEDLQLYMNLHAEEYSNCNNVYEYNPFEELEED